MISPAALPDALRITKGHLALARARLFLWCNRLAQPVWGSPMGFTDFQAFGKELGASVQPGQIMRVNPVNGLALWLEWIDCTPATDNMIAQAVI